MRMIDYELLLGDPRSFYAQIMSKGIWTDDGLLSMEMYQHLLTKDFIFLEIVPTFVTGVDLTIYSDHPTLKPWSTLENCLRRRGFDRWSFVFDRMGRIKTFPYKNRLTKTEKALLQFVQKLSPEPCLKPTYERSLIPGLRVEIQHLIKTALSLDVWLNPVLLALTNQIQGKISGLVLEGDEKLCWDWLREEKYWEKKHPIASLDQATNDVMNAIEKGTLQVDPETRRSTIKAWIRKSGLQPQTAKGRGVSPQTKARIAVSFLKGS